MLSKVRFLGLLDGLIRMSFPDMRQQIIMQKTRQTIDLIDFIFHMCVREHSAQIVRTCDRNDYPLFNPRYFLAEIYCCSWASRVDFIDKSILDFVPDCISFNF